MRQETIVKTYYTFDELDDETKEKAVQNLWNLNVDFEWWDFTYEDAKIIGLKLTGFDLDRNEIYGDLTDYADEVARAIISNHGNNCDTYQTAKNFLAEFEAEKEKQRLEDEEFEEDYFEMDEESNNQFRLALLEDYLIILKHEYEYLTSEEAIIDTIMSNKYEFDLEGNLI